MRKLPPRVEAGQVYEHVRDYYGGSVYFVLIVLGPNAYSEGYHRVVVVHSDLANLGSDRCECDDNLLDAAFYRRIA